MNPYDLKLDGLSEIEDKILAKLSACMCPAVNSVELFSNQFNVQDVDTTSFLAPALFLTTIAGDQAEVQHAEFDVTFGLYLIVNTNDSRGDRAKSAICLVDKSLKCVRNVTFGLDCQNVKRAENIRFRNQTSPAFIARAMAAYEINFDLRIRLI